MSDQALLQLPNAESQCIQLAEELRSILPEDPMLIGIHSGGAWVAERLCELLDRPKETFGTLDVSFYRDDFAEKGLHKTIKASLIPLDIEGRTIILVDDVLYTGRTTRAALNEIFDYGRPKSVQLAVLADRGQRELPICPQYCIWHVSMPSDQILALDRTAHNKFAWRTEHAC